MSEQSEDDALALELPGGAYASIGNYTYGFNGMEKDDACAERSRSKLRRLEQRKVIYQN